MTGSGNNTYLLAGGGSAALIDAGIGDRRHVAEVQAELTANGARLDVVLVTHGHPDHAAGAEALAAAHPRAAFRKHPWPGEDSRYRVDWEPIAEGDTVMAGDWPLVALHTPGHSPDHVAFWYEPGRTVFTGDLVILGGSVMIHTSRGGNLAEYLASLERLVALGPRRLLPAHGARIDNPREVLVEHIEHRRMRERQVLEALRAGRSTVQRIAESIYDGLEPALMPAACENVRAHLEKLKSEGRAADESGRWALDATG